MNQTLVVRDIDNGPDASTRRYWFADDPFMTHFFNAVSSTFPEGERFFIRAVRRYADTAPEVDADTVQRFVRQEGHHSRAHDSHIHLLEAQGFTGVLRMNRAMGIVMRWLNERAPRLSLALTVAIEHVTAVFAHEFLRDPDHWLGPMVPEMQRLWRWHAVEESEHKAVAFDVYKANGLPLWLRRAAMIDATLGFLAEVFVRHSYLLIKDRQFRPRVLATGFRALFGRGGYLRRMAPHISPFYRADFHPNDLDDRALLEQRCRSWGLSLP